MGNPTPGATAHTVNVQETQDNLAVPIPEQVSKAPVHQSEAPFEFEVDSTALKVNKLEKLFKRAQGVNSILDLEDGYTESAVTLLEWFKMPRIDCFDGSGDPMVYLHLFSDILRPMGLTTAQKLSLFGRTMSGIAVIWYVKLEDSVKQNWEELAEVFIAQYSHNTQIEVITRDLEVTRQEPKEGFSEFDFIDEETIPPPKGPRANTDPSSLHLNQIHILPSDYNPSIYITPAYLPKPKVFIPESMDLCMMDAPEPQSSQTHEPTTSKLIRMIKDLQRTVVDLAFGILAPSSTTSHARNFMPKCSPILGRATFEEGQSLGKVKASGKNKVGAGIGPHEHLQWVVEALKAEGLNKQQVLAVVAKTVDVTFVAQVEGSLNQGASREKRCRARNVPFSSNPTLIRDHQTQLVPANPFAGTSNTLPTLKYPSRGQRVFHPLYKTLSKTLQIRIEKGHLKPLEPRPLPKNLPPSHNSANYCAFHQQAGHDTNMCFRLHHEIQDLIDNEVIIAPGFAKSIDTGSVNLGDNVII
ncbi:hypothetical protein HYC85_028516 [Camellia sinensis]|uniref:Retrotransposon gag domain-containing protein n=1 Tax=Camellia sinensis TaxID=4442 RepID=A0A7J7FVG9_CAMSI|nr:hypothetical protein HYC85_028516 [Camellia sinensis]